MEPTFAILLTDREKLGVAIRLLTEEGDPTLQTTKAKLFKREQDAKAWLTKTYRSRGAFWNRDDPVWKRDMEPRFLYTVAEIVVVPRRPKPERELPPLLPMSWAQGGVSR